MTGDDLFFMKKALQQAEASGRCQEVPIGAVLVKEGSVVSRGQNRMIRSSDPSAHAEVVALRRAGARLGNYRLLGADLYVTLEPCLMCYSALVLARIRRLVYAADDGKSGVFTSGKFDRIKDIYNHVITVEKGVLREQASSLLKDFFLARRGAGAVERDGLENRYTG